MFPAVIQFFMSDSFNKLAFRSRSGEDLPQVKGVSVGIMKRFYTDIRDCIVLLLTLGQRSTFTCSKMLFEYLVFRSTMHEQFSLQG